MGKEIFKHELIAKQTAAADASRFLSRGSTVFVDGTLTTEEITINYLGINGVDETPAYDNDGIAVVLSSTKSEFNLAGNAHIKLSKPTTTNAVGVYMVY